MIIYSDTEKGTKEGETLEIPMEDEERLLESADNAEQVYIETILPEKMAYNLRAIENFSFWQDIKTMIATVVAVMK